MPTLINSVPKYRKHRASGQAVVTIQGRDHYLGPWKSKASKIAYDRLIAEWLSEGRPSMPVAASAETTIVEVLSKYWCHVRGYYVKDGRPTSEQACIRCALGPLKELYGRLSASEFGPKSLKAIRQIWIESGKARTTINQDVGRIRRLFRWAAAEQLIPASIYEALKTVPGLQRGRCKAREPNAVEPIADHLIDATIAHLPPVVADMLRVQRLTAARPSEICKMRPIDIDRSNELWIYRPPSHKTVHRGRHRVIGIGPQAQQILLPYLPRDELSFVFCPRESEQKRRQGRHENRKTPLARGNRPGTNRKPRPSRAPGERFTTDSYRRAIHRACRKAGIERWSPNRVRHQAATLIRKEFGIEVAQVILGHASLTTTEVYAEPDVKHAEEVLRRLG